MKIIFIKSQNWWNNWLRYFFLQEDFCEIEQIIKYNNSNICSSFLRETKLCLQFWTCILHKVYDKDHMEKFFYFYLVIRSECYLNAMHQTQTSIQIWNGTLHTHTYTYWRSHLLFPCSQGWLLYNVCIRVMCWLFNVTPSTLWSVRIAPNVVLYTIPYERYIPMWPCNLSIHTHTWLV